MGVRSPSRGAAAPPSESTRLVEVRAVRGRRELDAFIRLPWRLYRGAPNWVPPLISKRRRHLDRSRNPFLDHAEAEFFLAWRDGVPVGRITAHVDHRLNALHGNRWDCSGSSSARMTPRSPMRC
jgi:hypothetical protein